MIKQWKSIIDDINDEINRLNAVIADTPFNTEFSHQMQRVKLRTTELQERLSTVIKQMKSEAAAERAAIDYMMAEFHQECNEALKKLSGCRITRAEKSHANWLHVQALKAQAEEGGES